MSSQQQAHPGGSLPFAPQYAGSQHPVFRPIAASGTQHIAQPGRPGYIGNSSGVSGFMVYQSEGVDYLSGSYTSDDQSEDIKVRAQVKDELIECCDACDDRRVDLVNDILDEYEYDELDDLLDRFNQAEDELVTLQGWRPETDGHQINYLVDKAVHEQHFPERGPFVPYVDLPSATPPMPQRRAPPAPQRQQAQPYLYATRPQQPSPQQQSVLNPPVQPASAQGVLPTPAAQGGQVRGGNVGRGRRRGRGSRGGRGRRSRRQATNQAPQAPRGSRALPAFTSPFTSPLDKRRSVWDDTRGADARTLPQCEPYVFRLPPGFDWERCVGNMKRMVEKYSPLKVQLRSAKHGHIYIQEFVLGFARSEDWSDHVSQYSLNSLYDTLMYYYADLLTQRRDILFDDHLVEQCIVMAKTPYLIEQRAALMASINDTIASNARL
ncbi:hypothetical protein F5Y13DRAFT_189802 [Hypoxylon sp. FL1857]|nr:hypothetical protein F5Y13DRAFT_189802 [Hypoxylon sp. FL1857]